MHGSSYIEKRLTASQRAADLKSKTTVLDGLKERRFEIAEPRLRHRKVGHPAEPASRRGRREHFLRRGRRSYYGRRSLSDNWIVPAKPHFPDALSRLQPLVFSARVRGVGKTLESVARGRRSRKPTSAI